MASKFNCVDIKSCLCKGIHVTVRIVNCWLMRRVFLLSVGFTQLCFGCFCNASVNVILQWNLQLCHFLVRTVESSLPVLEKGRNVKLKGLCQPWRMRESILINLKKTARLFQVLSEVVEAAFIRSNLGHLDIIGAIFNWEAFHCNNRSLLWDILETVYS